MLFSKDMLFVHNTQKKKVYHSAGNCYAAILIHLRVLGRGRGPGGMRYFTATLTAPAGVATR